MEQDNSCILLSLVLSVLTLAGCEQTGRRMSEPAVQPQIVTECIAGYHQEGRDSYITQQTHAFNPSVHYLRIVANEPTGRYTFVLHEDTFLTVNEPTAFLSGLPASFVNEPLAVALFYAFSAGAELLDTDAMEAADILKLEGQWYEPFHVNTQNDISITLYRNPDTTRIERVQVDAGPEVQWLLQNYNFRYSLNLDDMVPRKIDVFDIRRGLASKRLMIEFEYKSVQKQQAQALSVQKFAETQFSSAN